MEDEEKTDRFSIDVAGFLLLQTDFIAKKCLGSRTLVYDRTRSVIKRVYFSQDSFVA